MNESWNLDFIFLCDWYYEYVYVSFDKNSQNEWKEKAKNKNLKLLTIQSMEQFIKASLNISKEHTEICISYFLYHDFIKGDRFAEILHRDGYKRLHLTDHRPYVFIGDGWLQFMGKCCPF